MTRLLQAVGYFKIMTALNTLFKHFMMLIFLNKTLHRTASQMLPDKHDAMQSYGAVEVRLYAFLTSSLGGGEHLVSRPCRFNPREMTPVPFGIRRHMSHSSIIYQDFNFACSQFSF